MYIRLFQVSKRDKEFKEKDGQNKVNHVNNQKKFKILKLWLFRRQTLSKFMWLGGSPNEWWSIVEFDKNSNVGFYYFRFTGSRIILDIAFQKIETFMGEENVLDKCNYIARRHYNQCETLHV